jgi:hypothetical protein
MVCGPIDHVFERVAGDHVRVVDLQKIKKKKIGHKRIQHELGWNGTKKRIHEYAPKVDSDEETEVEISMQREEEDEEVVGHGLEIAVDGMESVRSEWGRDCFDKQVRKDGGGYGKLFITEPFVMRFV